jgi:DNA helicase IV
VFENYRNALQARGKVEWTDIIRQTRKHIVATGIDLPYRAAVIDEAQDFHPEEWKLLRAIIPKRPNDLFLVGDAHQRIYDRKVTLGRCGIEVRGRSHKLRINYRTTEQIRDWAVGRLRGCDIDNLDGELDNQVGYRSLLSGVKPEHHHFAILDQAADFINMRVQELADDRGRPLESICLVARTRKLIDTACVPALESSKIPFTILGKDPEPEKGGVRVATMHRVKGLEFPCMILVGINDGVIPYRIASLEGNPTAEAEHEVRERSLLFVAATRARETLDIVSWEKASPLLE